jgi:hypothetical protein
MNNYSGQIKEMIQGIARNVDTIESTMGVYSGKEKHTI